MAATLFTGTLFAATCPTTLTVFQSQSQPGIFILHEEVGSDCSNVFQLALHIDGQVAHSQDGCLIMPCVLDYTFDARCVDASNHTAQAFSSCSMLNSDGGCNFSFGSSEVVSFSTPQPPKPTLTPHYDSAIDSLVLAYNWAESASVLPSLQVYVDGALRTDLDVQGCLRASDPLSGTCSIPLGLGCSTGQHDIHVIGARCGNFSSNFTVTADTVALSAECPKEATSCNQKPSCPTCTIPQDPCTPYSINTGSGDARVVVPLFSISQTTSTLNFALTSHSLQPQFGWLMTSPFGDVRVTHTFNQSLVAVSTNRLQWLTPSGDRSFFDKVSDSLWAAGTPASSRDTIVKNSDGTYTLRHLDGSNTNFTGTTCQPDNHLCGRWMADRDRRGNSVSGTYGSDGVTDAAGNFRPFLASITDNEGRQLTFTYSNSRLSSVQLPDGGLWRFAYQNGAVNVFDPLHTGATQWRTVGLVSVMDDAEQVMEDHELDGQLRGRSSYSTDRKRAINVQYDTPAPGQSTIKTWENFFDGTVRDTQVLNLSLVRGSYLPTQVTGTCSMCGGGSESTGYVLNDHGQATAVTSASGIVTRYQYDSLGNVISRTDASGTPAERTTAFAFENPNWPTFATRKTESSVTGNGFKTTTATWNTTETVLTESVSGRLSTTGALVTFTTTKTYDNHHRLLSIDGPRTDVTDLTNFTYYDDNDSNLLRRGRLHTSTDALGHVTTLDDYDLFGTARTVTDPNGVTTSRVTDGRGRITSSTILAVTGDPNESTNYTTTYTYDSRDRLTDVVMPRGTQTRYRYMTGPNWLTDTIRLDLSGNEIERIHLTLNLLGEKVAEEEQSCSSPSTTCSSWVTKRSESFVYNQQSRLSKIHHPVPAGSEVIYAYDHDGKLINIQDENHTTPNTIYEYDPLDRLHHVTQTLASASGGSIGTTYEYNVQDNLASVTDPNENVTTYAYDDFGRLQQQVSPVTGTTIYSYDAVGNLVSMTDANGATTARTYDSLNRVLTATSSRAGLASEQVTYTYDATVAGSYGIGRLSTMNTPEMPTSYRYERRGLLTRKANADFATTFTYDADGNRAGIGYPSGQNVSYAFDAANRPISATSGSATFINSASYAPFGPLTSMTYGNGTTKSVQYDSRYRTIENKLSSTTSLIADYVYQEDAAGNITQIHDALNPAYNRDFGYDDLNRLTTANTGASLWGTGTYQYDAMGNMTSLHLGSRSVSFSYIGSTPKLQSVNGAAAAVSYDGAGNDVKNAAYSARNLMYSFDAVADSGTAYLYDGQGVRAATSVHVQSQYGWRGTSTRRSIYSPELNLLAQSDWSSGNVGGDEDEVPMLTGTEYIWFGGQPVAQTFTRSDSPMRYTFTDHLGTPLLQATADRTVIWRVEYEPYGDIFSYRAGNAADPQTLRFPGQEAPDAMMMEEGETYNIFRWYRSGWGRYTQADPIGLRGGANLFSYVDAMPTARVDPRGLIGWTCSITVGLKVGNLGGGIALIGVKCVSDCKGNRERRVSMLGGAAGTSIGLFPIGGYSSTVHVEDGQADAKASSLDGAFTLQSMAASLGYGWSQTHVILGLASGDDGGSWGWSGSSVGFDSLYGYVHHVTDFEFCCKQ